MLMARFSSLVEVRLLLPLRPRSWTRLLGGHLVLLSHLCPPSSPPRGSPRLPRWIALQKQGHAVAAGACTALPRLRSQTAQPGRAPAQSAAPSRRRPRFAPEHAGAASVPHLPLHQQLMMRSRTRSGSNSQDEHREPPFAHPGHRRAMSGWRDRRASFPAPDSMHGLLPWTKKRNMAPIRAALRALLPRYAGWIPCGSPLASRSMIMLRASRAAAAQAGGACA